MEKYLYPTQLVSGIIIGPSECGKSVFLTNLILNIFNEYDKIYIYSPSLHQDLHQKLIKCFGNSIYIHIMPNIFNEEDIDVVIEEVIKNKEFEKTDILLNLDILNIACTLVSFKSFLFKSSKII